MNRPLAAVILAVVLVLAGCTGGGESPSGTTPETQTGAGDLNATGAPDPTETAATDTPEPTDTPAQAAPGGHPASRDGALNASRLGRDHMLVISRADSFTVVNNRTVTYLENGSVRSRSVVVNRGDLAATSHRIDRRSIGGDGGVRVEETRYENATTSCLVSPSGAECRDAGVGPREIVGLTMETTSLETLAAPDFSPDGIARRDGRSLYRYSATSFRASMPSGTAKELYGADPALETATLLVHPSGRIVSYALTYRLGGETPQELNTTYVTSGIDATTVVPPAAVG